MNTRADRFADATVFHAAPFPRRLLRVLEHLAAAASLILLATAGLAVADAQLMSRAALDDFIAGSEATAGTAAAPANTDEAMGVLRIERIGVEVPVFPDTGRVALRRGVGAIEGTAAPGTEGHIGIAGHRDGFFRPLKDITVGDVIELETRSAVQTFRVAEIRIVDPLDTSVLDPSDDTRLTLVTCHPFYYVGYAPDRYIVHAALLTQRDANDRAGATL